ncbi:hypothetical protein N7508_008801 [Penicillium antarcticum]|nr:uncharacterized protein N7508_008801 [Penicillium antarcticum]KAJ5293980.1 hypothetical protein N7508_008801 [Penicillium antarcticum]
MQLPDGRTLGYAEYGPETGYPLMYLHGYPQCRYEGSVMENTLHRHGIRMIAPDRPGFGLSTDKSNRRIMDWPADVQALAGHLGLPCFALMGGSGGGPYTLACAHALPHEMMSAVGILAGGGDWQAGADHMPWIYRISALAADYWPAGLQGSLGILVWMFRSGLNSRKGIQWLDGYLRKDKEKHSKTVEERRMEILRALFEPFKQGAGPAAYEAKLLSQDWGIAFGDITYNNLHIWHAGEDWNSPLPMTEFYVKQLTNNPSFKVYENDTHWTIHRHLDDILSELIPESSSTKA